MANQYVMRAFNTNTNQHVSWTANGTPDFSGNFSGYNPSDLTNITIDYVLASLANTTVGSGAVNGNGNFGAENIFTTGTLTSGPAFSTSDTTGLLTLDGKLIVNAVPGSNPATTQVSDAAQGIIYFDATTNKFMVSENDGYFAYLAGPNYIDQNIITTGMLTSGPAIATSNTTGLLILNGEFIVNAISAPLISDAGQGILYFDNAINRFLVSENGGPFSLLTGGDHTVTITSGPYTATTADNIIFVGTISLPLTINLPASPESGQTITVKDSNGGSFVNNITILGNGHNIDGSSSPLIINKNFGAYNLIYNGTQWNIL